MNQFLKTKKEIESWLDRMGVTWYTLLSDSEHGFVVDVNDDVDISNQSLDFIPVKFNRVIGNFNCSKNHLVNLVGAPKELRGSFNCKNNVLTSLLGCPQTIHNYFTCENNLLTSLHYGPEQVGRFSCETNFLTDLKYCPQNVKDYFMCDNNKITTLLYHPDSVGGDFSCSYNAIESLQFCIKNLGGDFYCHDNPLLGEAQNTMNFKEIYKIHEELVRIQGESRQLQSIIHAPKQSIFKNHKI